MLPPVPQHGRAEFFRANHPVDDWPEGVLPPRPRNVPAEALTAFAARLRSTATGKDPVAFEQAVCDAFALMGFIATHIGGHVAPDGTLDPLSGRSGAARFSNARPHTPASRRTSLRPSRQSFATGTAQTRQ